MDIEVVILQMVVLFILVIAGFVSRRCKLMDVSFDKKFSNLVIQLTAPCLILASTMGDEMPDRKLILPLLGVSAFTYALLILVSSYLPRIMPVKKEERGMYSFMLTFANVGFIGYPIIASIFGHSSIFYACILNVINTLTIFVWGVMFVKGSKENSFDWHLLLSPSMIATYVSIVIVVFGWRTPACIAQPCTMLGNMTVPAALMVIGSSIAGMPLRRMVGNIGIYTMCILRLLVIPLAMYYLIAALHVDHRVAAINAVLVGMPVASFGTMFCMKYEKDVTVMAQGTFLSTLLSVLSIPLLAFLIS